MIKEIVKGMWQFARFLFGPQRGETSGSRLMVHDWNYGKCQYTSILVCNT